MNIIHIIFWIIIILSGLYLLFSVLSNVVEGFNTELDTREKDLKNEINNYITLVNETLCSSYKQILDLKIDENLPDDQKILPPSEQDPDDRNKAKAKAISDIAQSTMMIPPIKGKLEPIDPSKVSNLQFSVKTTGFLFPCPPPKDALQIPNNIDEFIRRSTDAFNPTIIDMKKNIEKSLSCPKKEKFTSSPVSESISDINYSIEGFNEANTDPKLTEQKIQVLQIKANVLKKVVLEPSFVKLITNIKTLKELKAKAESGEASTNCSA